MILTSAFLFIFTLICAKNIRYGVYAVIFSMPLYLWRFSIFGIPTTVLEIMIYILFLIWVITGVHSLECKNFSLNKINFYRLKPEFQILNTGIILLFLGVIISTAFSSDIRTSLGIFKGWFVDPFLFFIIFISVIKKEKHLILSFKSWLVSGIVVSLISIFYLLNNNLTFDGRLKAFFLSPNHLAMYLAPAFLIVLFFLLNIKKVSSIKYQVSIVILIIILIPLYFTYSYGAFLGIFAAIIYLFYKKDLSFPWKRKSTATTNLKKHSFLKIIASIILISFIIFITSNKFDQIVNSKNRSSFHSRLMIWNTSIEIIKDSPLFGIGPGTFQETYLSYSKKFSEPYLEWAVPQPHNIFFAFYLQTGIIGFVGFILILIWFFNYCREKAPSCLYRQIINVLMIYILVHGLIDTTYWKNDLALIFWLIIGMMVVLRRISR